MNEANALLWAVGAPILTGLMGALLAHALTKNRDLATRRAIQRINADLRKRHFKKFILRCRYSLERLPHNNDDELWHKYASFAPDIMTEAELVSGDFIPLVDFKRLVACAGEWRQDDAVRKASNTGVTLRDVLRDSILDVYTFIDTQ